MKADLDVAILGAGLGGIGMGCMLKAQGITAFRIFEKESRPGGTWRDNAYPGAACDTESHLYCYSFALHLSVSRLYAGQPELLRYAESLIDGHDLAPHIAYDSEITQVRWDDAQMLWAITFANGNTLTARAFIAAWGQLNRPQVPDIAGADRFAGHQFHSARWPADLQLSGQRIASIGNAASAIQYIPSLARQARHLTVFQRSPNWIVPRGDRPYTREELALYTSNPEAFRRNKAELFAWRETTFLRMREGSDEARLIEDEARAHLARQVPDESLRAKLLPDFPLGCKRVLRSDDYYPALMRDNVALETAPIREIVPEGIVTADGALHAVDIIVYGTGFETQSFQGPVEIFGRNAASLRSAWAGGARAYKGMTVPAFPNFFMVYGPNTNLGHNSILSMFEAQFGYITQALSHAFARHCAVDVREDAYLAYDEALQHEMSGTAWAGNCTSWYKNAQGRVVNNWSGPVQAYIDATKRFDVDAYQCLEAVPS